MQSSRSVEKVEGQKRRERNTGIVDDFVDGVVQLRVLLRVMAVYDIGGRYHPSKVCFRSRNSETFVLHHSKRFACSKAHATGF
jgi:ribosomal protein S27AE